MADLAVTALRLGQFRNHAGTQLDLDNRPVALFGANGAGKTNILEAVSLLSPGRGLRRAAADEMGRRDAGLGWRIRADLTSLGHMHEIETTAQPASARQVRINDKSATQTALGRIARVIWLIPAMDRLWIEGADGRRRFLDRATLSFEPAHAEVVLAYEKAMRERNRLLKDGIMDDHWYRALEMQMAEAGAQIVANRQMALDLLTTAQQSAETSFPAAELALEQPGGEALPETAADLADAMAESRPADMRAGRSLVGPHRSDLVATFAAKNVPARDCSTGEQKALLISLILANGRALKDTFGAAPILLLDEVAAHLDPNRRAALYDEISALGAQAWMTGTEPALFAELGPRAQYFEVSEIGGLAQLAQKDGAR